MSSGGGMSLTVTLHPNRCQDPEPRDSPWRELHVTDARNTWDCARKCHRHAHATGFQYNFDDHFCGCLSTCKDTPMAHALRDQNHTFAGSCIIGVFDACQTGSSSSRSRAT